MNLHRNMQSYVKRKKSDYKTEYLLILQYCPMSCVYVVQNQKGLWGSISGDDVKGDYIF